MVHAITNADYYALAEFRYRIRMFLEGSAKAARSLRLEPEQYELLLAVRGMPPGRQATIQALAKQLCVRHNTVVERVDRLARPGYIRRSRGSVDGRVVNVSLRARGVRLLDTLARKRLAELRRSGPDLIRALGKVVRAERRRKKLGSSR
ncbi:MAG: MarR family transcriptional regulator [Candidatus Acidiferrales bacterium]